MVCIFIVETRFLSVSGLDSMPQPGRCTVLIVPQLNCKDAVERFFAAASDMNCHASFEKNHCKDALDNAITPEGAIPLNDGFMLAFILANELGAFCENESLNV